MGDDGEKWGAWRPVPMSQLKEPNYTGRFPRPLDDRNRVTIPSEWRFAHDSEDMLLAIPKTGPKGNHVVLLPPSGAARLKEKFDAIPLFDEAGQAAKEDFYSRCQQVWFDKAGRILLNDDLMAHAGITKSTDDKNGAVHLAGAGSQFSIYAAEVWAESETRPATNHADTMRRFGI